MKTIATVLFVFFTLIVTETNAQTNGGTKITITSVPTSPTDTTDPVFSYAEEMPKFPGEDPNTALQSYLKKNLVYPTTGKECPKSGTVYVEFVIRKDGSVTDVKIIRGIPLCPVYGDEVVRVFTSMPKWNPGKMNGKPVSVKMVMPVRFEPY